MLSFLKKRTTDCKWPADCDGTNHNEPRRMNPYRYSTLLIALPILLSACSQRIYFPDSSPSFGFREKGHFKAFASAKAQSNSTSDTGSTLYRQARSSALAAEAGYAVSDHWGVYGAYRGVNNTHRSDLSSRNGLYDGGRAEIGAVYFAPLGRHSSVEAMGGFGLGNLRSRSREASQQYTLAYRRYSLQGAVSFQTNNEALRGYGGMRLALQDFYAFESPDAQLRYTIGQPLVSGSNPNLPPRYTDIVTRPLGVVEPFVGLEAGYRWLRFTSQSGFTSRYFGPQLGGFSLYTTVGIGFQWPALPERRREDRY